MKRLIIAIYFFSARSVFTQEVAVGEIQIGCGNNYFSESKTWQPPLIVRGKWCGDSFFWTPIGIGDTLMEEAFRNGTSFTGIAVSKTNEGKINGMYTFKNGFIEKLEEFYYGQLILSCSYAKGIPNGEHVAYDPSGSLSNLQTYNSGILHGKYYLFRVGDFGGCIREGLAINGEITYTKNTCD